MFTVQAQRLYTNAVTTTPVLFTDLTLEFQILTE
jgi:hypothetical protein